MQHRTAARRGWRRLIAGGAAAALLASGLVGLAATAGQARTVTDADRPHMGWSSYSQQVYAGKDSSRWISRDVLIKQSDAMKKQLGKFGYNYINVDAGWNDGTDEFGRPTPSKTLYPNGLQEVIDHVHRNGQKFGLYFIPGIDKGLIDARKPIKGAPGCTTGDVAATPLQQADYWGIGHKVDFSKPCAVAWIDSIADRLGEWGVDFVKFDSVTPGSGITDGSLDSRDDVRVWSQALKRNGIRFELSWAVDINQADYWREMANGWRVDWDVECYCNEEALTSWANVARLFPRMVDWWHFGGRGGWNDLDSISVGNARHDGLTQDERRAAMTFWAINAAPIYLGNDMTDLDKFGLSLLTNKDVIGINQAGHPARPVASDPSLETWYIHNDDGTITVALFNLGRVVRDIKVNWADVGLTGGGDVRDVWADSKVSSSKDGYVAKDVPIHGVQLIKVTPAKGATVTLNDDDQRLALEGTWKRNGGHEVAQVSQTLPIAVGDSGSGEAPQAPVGGRTQLVNDSDPKIVYSGDWGHSTGRNLGDYQDDVHYAEKAGDSFEYTFTGSGVAIVTEKEQDQGEMEIYLDGVLVATTDTSLPAGTPRQSQVTVWSSDQLENGTHTVKAVMKSGKFMLLDRIDVRQPSLLTPDTAAFDKAKPADVVVTLGRDGSGLREIVVGGKPLAAGKDYTVSGTTVTIAKAWLAKQAAGQVDLEFRFAGDAFSDVMYATDNGAAVSLTFNGTSVRWIGPMGPGQGEVKVSLDGKVVKTINTAADVRSAQQELFSATNLKNGSHTLRLEKVSGDVMLIDLVSYTKK